MNNGRELSLIRIAGEGGTVVERATFVFIRRIFIFTDAFYVTSGSFIIVHSPLWKYQWEMSMLFVGYNLNPN